MTMQWEAGTRPVPVDDKPEATLNVYTAIIERNERYIISIEEHYDVNEPSRSKYHSTNLYYQLPSNDIANYDVILRSDDGIELTRMRMAGPVEDLKKIAIPTILMGLNTRREYLDSVIDDVRKLCEEMRHE